MSPQNVLSGFNLQKKTEIHLESFGKKVLLFLSRYFFYVENLGFQSFTSLVADLRHERNRIFHITGPVYAKTYIYLLGICL